jgi:hypothetical protein
MDDIIKNIVIKWRECITEAEIMAKVDGYKAQSIIFNFAEKFAAICDHLKYSDEYYDFEESEEINSIVVSLQKMIDKIYNT